MGFFRSVRFFKVSQDLVGPAHNLAVRARRWELLCYNFVTYFLFVLLVFFSVSLVVLIVKKNPAHLLSFFKRDILQEITIGIG